MFLFPDTMKNEKKQRATLVSIMRAQQSIERKQRFEKNSTETVFAPET